ncbi:MAG: hypothetical protein EXR98_18575 [Gemmataceae bacterium]|nr:hypothetical protein [Gemmataceae bacterium]
MRRSSVLCGLMAMTVLATQAGARPQPIVFPRDARMVPLSQPTVDTMAVSPDGKLVALGWGNIPGGNIELASVKTGRGPGVLLNYSPSITRGTPTAMVFSPDSTRLAVGDSGGRILIWDVTKTGTELLCIEFQYERGGSWTFPGIRTIAYSADGKSLVGVLRDGVVKRWNAATGKSLKTFSLGVGNHVNPVALDKAGKLAVSGHENGTVHLWNVETGSLTKSWHLAKGTTVRSLAFAPDGKKFVIGLENVPVPQRPLIRLLGATPEQVSQTVVVDTKTGERLCELPVLFTNAQFGPSGKYLATCEYSGPVKIWDIATSRSVQTIAKEQSGCLQLIPSSDGTLLFARGSRWMAWNIQTGAQVWPR